MWLYLWCLEALILSSTIAIVLLLGKAFDTLQTTTRIQDATQYQHMFITVTGLLFCVSHSIRDMNWHKIGANEARLVRLGIPLFLASTFWAGMVMAMLPRVFLTQHSVCNAAVQLLEVF